MDLNTDLTDAQKQAFKDNANDLEEMQYQLDEVRRKALSRLDSAGVVGGTDILNCLACIGCEGWSEGRDGRCDNCPHGFFSHNVI
ncbi:hypothetical protein [Streptomyces chryseus]|uniref:hypothetical protein n=1 Tax=Streptomyces chryseus TaxID=68186 RepID=UPI00110F9D34|nr:hypothetical protein [Streptomyces chryseus]